MRAMSKTAGPRPWKLAYLAAWSLAVEVVLAACGGAAAGPPASSSTPKPATSASAASAPAASVAAVSSAPQPAASTGASGASPTGSIKLGFSQPGVGYGPFFAAKDAGLFSKNGLD